MLNMLNSEVNVYLSSLVQKRPFLGKFGPKNQSCLFKMKFAFKTNSNMLNLIVMFIFCFGPETSVLGKFGPKNKKCLFMIKLSP